MDSSHRLTGLTDEEAAARLAADGFNDLPATRPRSLFAIAVDVVREPMFLLLIGSGSIYLPIGTINGVSVGPALLRGRAQPSAGQAVNGRPLMRRESPARLGR